MKPLVIIVGLVIGPVCGFLVWRAGLAFQRGQLIRGLVWSSAALVELLAIVAAFDALAMRFA